MSNRTIEPARCKFFAPLRALRTNIVAFSFGVEAAQVVGGFTGDARVQRRARLIEAAHVELAQHRQIRRTFEPSA